MTFQKANVLTTREFVFGSKRIGQILAVPSGRLDKVSIYLEPIVADAVAATGINLILEVYDLDIDGSPTGAALLSDSKLLSDITISGNVNFRINGYVPTVVAIVLRVENGDENNHVAWRYVSISSGGEELLTSTDDGTTWAANPTRKFSYKTFSVVSNALDTDEQTAAISAGTVQTIEDDTSAEFEIAELNRTAVSGDTVVVSFGDFVITLVVDQSGSMTWNDRENLRYDFLKEFIADIDSSLPVGSTATYSLIKFRGRRIGKMTIAVQGSENNGLHFDGVRIVRKAGSAPSDSTDGIVVYEGSSQQFIDDGSVSALAPSVVYHYSVFSYATFDESTLFSSAKDDFTLVVNPPTSNRPPYGVAAFKTIAVATDSFGTPLVDGDDDLGYRKVNVSWLNPAGYNYSNITLVRRDDRVPESPTDGTVLLSNVAASTTTYLDDFGGTYYFPNGLTYYYRIFTSNTDGVKSYSVNSPKSSVAIPTTLRPWEEVESPVAPFGFDTTSPLPPVVTVVESNGEIKLSWVAADVDSKRFKVFYHETRFPIATDDKGRNYDGSLIYDGTGSSFTHRFLTNGEPHFYAIIALDEVENASTPEKPLIDGKPPRPSSDAIVFLAPDPVTNISVENINVGSNRITWENPVGPTFTGETFFFGDTVRIVSNVEFLDSGTSESFLVYEFVETDRKITPVEGATEVDPNIAIQFGHIPLTNENSILATVSMTPLIALLNKIEGASISLKAALRVKNRITGAIIAEVETNPVTISFVNPFSLSIENEPSQKVSRRTWQASPDNDPLAPCQEYEYKINSFSGVYAYSGDPFFALIEASYQDLPLGGSLNVEVQLLDKATGELTNLIKIPQTQTAKATLVLSDVEDEVVDRSGLPTGEMTTRSLLPLILPPSNIPGDFILQVTATFNGYIRKVKTEIHYEPILNVDLNLNAFLPDNVDRTEQSAFVYLAPFDAPQSEKIPVDDFTVTSWSIRPLCKNLPIRPLQSEDSVPGLGVKSFTRGGIAKNIYWGPGEEVDGEQFYEVGVKVQANGMTGEGFGMLQLGAIEDLKVNRIFLRNQTVSNFFKETLYADGETVSTWEVLGHPEDDAGTGPTDSTSGQSFVTAIVTGGGNVPLGGLEDGRIVTMTARLLNKADPNINPPTSEEMDAILDSLRIKTNMTGTNGKARSAKAKIENGKAVFEITINARVPVKEETITEDELKSNLFYKIYGLQFNEPNSGLAVSLTVTTPVEINGKAVAFYGGGGNVVTSSPPCFMELLEPLRTT